MSSQTVRPIPVPSTANVAGPGPCWKTAARRTRRSSGGGPCGSSRRCLRRRARRRRCRILVALRPADRPPVRPSESLGGDGRRRHRAQSRRNRSRRRRSSGGYPRSRAREHGDPRPGGGGLVHRRRDPRGVSGQSPTTESIWQSARAGCRSSWLVGPSEVRADECGKAGVRWRWEARWSRWCRPVRARPAGRCGPSSTRAPGRRHASPGGRRRRACGASRSIAVRSRRR